MRLRSRLLIGAIAGMAGTIAMTATMRRLHKQLPLKERHPLTPREIVDSALAPPDGPARDLTLAAHFAYGAGCGAVLAAVNPKVGRWSGAAAGGAIWITSYMGWLPAAGLLAPASAHPARRNLVMIGSHFAWGWATAEAIRELGKARDDIFAAGPDRDIPPGRSG